MLQLGHAGEGVERPSVLMVPPLRLSLQLGHAGEGVESLKYCFSCFYCHCFNWATPVKAWKVWPSSSDFTNSIALQLGHAGEGVERMKEEMGLIEAIQLQLGHAGEGVERWPLCFPVRSVPCFNWATPVKAWKEYHGIKENIV